MEFRELPKQFREVPIREISIEGGGERYKLICMDMNFSNNQKRRE